MGCHQQGRVGGAGAQEWLCFVCAGLSSKHVGICFPQEQMPSGHMSQGSGSLHMQADLTSWYPGYGGEGSPSQLLLSPWHTEKPRQTNASLTGQAVPAWKLPVRATGKHQPLPLAEIAQLAVSTNFLPDNCLCRFRGTRNRLKQGSTSSVLLFKVLWCGQHSCIGLQA